MGLVQFENKIEVVAVIRLVSLVTEWFGPSEWAGNQPDSVVRNAAAALVRDGFPLNGTFVIPGHLTIFGPKAVIGRRQVQEELVAAIETEVESRCAGVAKRQGRTFGQQFEATVDFSEVTFYFKDAATWSMNASWEPPARPRDSKRRGATVNPALGDGSSDVTDIDDYDDLTEYDDLTDIADLTEPCHLMLSVREGAAVVAETPLTVAGARIGRSADADLRISAKHRRVSRNAASVEIATLDSALVHVHNRGGAELVQQHRRTRVGAGETCSLGLGEELEFQRAPAVKVMLSRLV